MRAELRRIRPLPGENLSAERRRIGTSLSRLGERYQWQEIEAPEYHCERLRLHGRLAELPAPADSNVLAFQRPAAAILPHRAAGPCAPSSSGRSTATWPDPGCPT